MKTANTKSAAYEVKVPVYSGASTYRTMGITSDPAANFMPGTSTRFLRSDGKAFKLTKAGLTEVTR
jgi:hypothetical protein